MTNGPREPSRSAALDGRRAVQNYIIAELEAMDATSPPLTKKAQKARRKRRAFLVEQLKIASGDHPRKVKPDAELLRAARKKGAGRPAAGADDARGSGRTPPGGERRGHPYRAACEEMGFGELRNFVESCLREVPSARPARSPNARPASREEFLDLLRLLRQKAREGPQPPPEPKDPGEFAPAKPFEPSARLVRARREKERAEDAVREAAGDPGAGARAPKALRRKRDLAAREARSLEAQERGDHEARREEAERYHARARAQYEASVRWRKGVLKGHGRQRKARLKYAEETAARIRSAFAMEDPTASGRLPWRPLPPGELTREGVREHYQRLAREHPNRRYVPERIDKAFALGPSRWWEGLDGFGGYVVFGYPGTDRVLLECAIYGNAIYVLGPDWQRLSRLSKQEAMKNPSSRRIAHRGGWFEALKAELGMR